MSIITAYGEKVGSTPSIDGDQDVEVYPVPSMEDQIVIHGQRVPVIMLPPTPLFLKKPMVHDPSLGWKGIMAVPGDAAPQPPVAKTKYMVVAPIHDKPRRPDFIVNLGDIDYTPRKPKPWLGPNPISVSGPTRPPINQKPEPTYYVAPSDIHGGLPEEHETEHYVVWRSPPIKAEIHDPSQTVSL